MSILFKKNRYIVLLKDNKKESIQKAENELNIQLRESKELNSKKMFEVLSNSNGIFFEKLNLAVVDEIPTQTLMQSVSDDESPILYWEEEREFIPVENEFEQIEHLQLLSKELQQRIDDLEDYLKSKQKDDDFELKNATWGLKAIGLNTNSLTGKGVNLCVLDTGFCANHPDFEGRNIEGKSFIDDEVWHLDGNGHGTHCIGTAAGNIDKTSGKRYGIAKEANIKVGKVLSDSGSGSTSGIIEAINWAIERGFQVVSMSLGSRTQINEKPSPIFEHIGKKALENNCLLIAAAGNDSRRPNMIRPVSSPANAKSILSVGALDSNLHVASFSNAGINDSDGGEINIAAPGVNVFSSYSTNSRDGQLHKRISGTSMATPHVAGIAALLFEKYPNATAKEIWEKLENLCQQTDHFNVRDLGKGIIQVPKINITNEEEILSVSER